MNILFRQKAGMTILALVTVFLFGGCKIKKKDGPSESDYFSLEIMDANSTYYKSSNCYDLFLLANIQIANDEKIGGDIVSFFFRLKKNGKTILEISDNNFRNFNLQYWGPYDPVLPSGRWSFSNISLNCSHQSGSPPFGQNIPDTVELEVNVDAYDGTHHKNRAEKSFTYNEYL